MNQLTLGRLLKPIKLALFGSSNFTVLDFILPGINLCINPSTFHSLFPLPISDIKGKGRLELLNKPYNNLNPVKRSGRCRNFNLGLYSE